MTKPLYPPPPALPEPVPAAEVVPPHVPTRPELDEPRWIDMCRKASLKQLDAVHYAKLKGAPQHLTAPEQYLWWAPEAILEAERNRQQGDNGWRDLPVLRRAEMIQLEHEQLKARRRGDVTGAFAVNLSLRKSDSGEFDIGLKTRGIDVVRWWTVVRVFVRAYGAHATLVIGGGAWLWHWLAEHGRAWMR